MKHGKKYTEAAKLVDRATFYEPNDAIALVKKTAILLNSMRPSKFTSEPVVTDVTLSSRSVAQLYCLTELVRL